MAPKIYLFSPQAGLQEGGQHSHQLFLKGGLKPACGLLKEYLSLHLTFLKLLKLHLFRLKLDLKLHLHPPKLRLKVQKHLKLLKLHRKCANKVQKHLKLLKLHRKCALKVQLQSSNSRLKIDKDQH